MNNLTNKKTIKNLLLLMSSFLFLSCSTPKDFIYFENATRNVKQSVTQKYDLKIQKDDLLSIVVSCSTPELTVPFNNIAFTSSSTNITSETKGYLVDTDGNIIMPIIGKIHAQGLTIKELALDIENRIVDGGYLTDPAVNVKILNFKISIIGEVKSPGVKNIEGSRVTILEAIGLAGDLTIYGLRNNVSLIREINGQREIVTIDLNSADLFSSPYYYLNPNDVVYIQPNKKQQRLSNSNPYLLSTIFSGTSLIVTIISLILRFNR